MATSMNVTMDTDDQVHIDWPDGLVQHFHYVRDNDGKVVQVISGEKFTTDETEEKQIRFLGESIRSGIAFLSDHPEIDTHLRGCGTLPFTVTIARKSDG